MRNWRPGAFYGNRLSISQLAVMIEGADRTACPLSVPAYPGAMHHHSWACVRSARARRNTKMVALGQFPRRASDWRSIESVILSDSPAVGVS